MNINWTKKWDLFVKQFIDLDGYEVVLEGLLNTVEIAFFGFLIGILIGTVIAAFQVSNSKNPIIKFFKGLGSIYLALFRGTPMVVQLLVGHFIIVPMFGLKASVLIQAVVIFGMNSGAYVSEIMRAGIQSVDKGQVEASRSLGLGYFTTFMKVVLPQAMKNSLPPLGNEMITLVKDTSIAGFISVLDLTAAFKSLGTSNYEFYIPYLMLALFYLVIVGIMTVILKLVERRLRKGDNR